MHISQELNDSIHAMLEEILQEETNEALVHVDRIGKTIDGKTFNTIVACGCGPSGERGVEDGICPT